MKTMFKHIKILLIAFMIMFVPLNKVFAIETSPIISDKTDVSPNKVWTINFNKPLDGTTTNTDNIIVTDSNGKKAAVVLRNVNNSVVVYPPVGGYIPAQKYTLSILNNVKSTSGINLKQRTDMNFTIKHAAEDRTSYSNLPQIKSVDLSKRPVIVGDKENFNITSNYAGDVQYRIFVQAPGSVACEEITAGYTVPTNAAAAYGVNVTKALSAGKYTVYTYVKRANTTGNYKDSNTDFDNYYISYFKCLTSLTSTKFELSPEYSRYTLNEMVDAEYKTGGAVCDNTDIKASRNMIEYYMNPNNFMDEEGKYQFLKLNYTEGITAQDLDTVLKGKGILNGKGTVFFDAAKEANISAAYLVSHALLETGNGTSKLANGILVSTVDGVPVTPKVTYNMFGIGAYDSNPNKFGSEKAYKQGWFDVDTAIKDGAKYIANSYINNAYKQDTNYKMKWNPNDGVMWKQYATDISWASKQAPNIKKIMDNYKDAVLIFQIPQFKQ